MRLWDNLRTLATFKESAVTPDLVLAAGGGWTWSGSDDISDYEKAYGKEVWVYACAAKRAEAVSRVPLKFYRNNEPTEPPRAFQYPNPDQSLADLIEEWELFMALTGNSYWELVMGGGRPVELYTLRPERMSVKPGGSRVAGYVHQVNGRVQRFEPEEVFHSKYPHPYNDWYGISPVEAAALSVDTSVYSRSYNKNFFKNGARPDFVLESDGQIKPEVRKRLAAVWRKMHSGVAAAHRPAILGGGLKFKTTGLSAKDAELISQAKLSREEICAVMKVPPALVGIFEYANYANAEAQEKMFWGGVVMSDLMKLQNGINRSILPQIGPGYTCEFDTGAIEALREDESERSAREVAEVQAGIVTVNEVREGRGLMPVPWGNEPPRRPEPVQIESGGDTGGDKSDGCGCHDAQDEQQPGLKQRDTNERIRTLKARSVRDKELDPIEASLKQAMQKVFEGQHDRALKRLAELVGKAMQSKLTGEELLDALEEAELTSTALYRDLLEAVYRGALNGDDLVGITTSWTLDSPEVVEAATRIGDKIGRGATKTTIKQLREQIGEGLENGEGYRGLKRRIDGLFEEYYKGRAETIARTESANAWADGEFTSFTNSGVDTLEWVFGAGPCSSGVCPGLDGARVSTGSDFEYWNDKGDLVFSGHTYPAHPNCTCTVVPVIE